MASPYSRTTKDGYEFYSQNENSGVRDTRKENSPLRATKNDNSFDFGFDWLEKTEPVRDYNWDSTKNDDYRQSRVVGWNALGDTVRDEAGVKRHDPYGRTMRENLGATTKRVDLGETGRTRREEYELSKSQRYPDENPYILNKFDHPGATRRVPLTEDALGSRDRPHRGWSDTRNTDLRETHSIDHKLPDYDYVHDRQHGDEDRHRPNRNDNYLNRSWHSMAADKNLMTGWHDMFGRIRTKWNGHNGIDDPTGGKSDISTTASSSSSYYDKRSRMSGRCKILIVAVLVFVLLAMCAIVTTIMLLPETSSAPEIGTYKLKATATNMEFTEDMLDPNSEQFQTITSEFCAEIDNYTVHNSDNIGYEGCVVTELQNGSVIFIFTIVINLSEGSQAPTNDAIFPFLGIELHQGTTTATLGNFVIGVAAVLQPFIQQPVDTPSPVPTKVPFNGACGNTNTQRCRTKRSMCKENVCACASDKIYVEDGDSCDLIECSEDAVIHGTVTNPTGTVPFGSTVDIECDDGYEIDGNISTLHCMENGTWSPNVSCIPVVCDEYSPPDNALFIVSSNANNRTFGSSLTIECKDGLSFADGTVSTELTCNASKIWYGEQTCEIYGSVAFEMENYILDTDKEGTLVCNVSKFTDSQTVTLEKIVEANITVILYDVQHPSKGPNVLAEMTEDNYNHTILDGDLSVWVNFAPVNEDDCGTYVCRISVYNGNNMLDTKQSYASVNVTGSINPDIDASPTSIEQGEEVTVECRGFSQAPLSDGDMFIETKNDGDNSFIAVSDDIPPIQSNFSGCQFVTKSSHTIQTNNLSGTVLVKCGLNATGSVSYSPEKSITVTPVTCDEEFVAPENAVILSNSSTIKVLSCKDGYEIEGNDTVICMNGNWSGSPTCIEKDCGDIPNISNGSLTNTSGTTYKAYAVFACDDGFNMNGKANVTCLASGSWESLPQCEQSDCGVYNAPPNSVVDNLTISCDVGFELVGNPSIVCQSNGNWSDFGECVPITCDPFKTPEYASSDANTSIDYKYEDKVNVTCNPGYTSEGDTVVVCNGSGVWTHVIACAPITCKDIDIDGAAPLNETHRFGDLVNITCEDGYVTDNETTVSCSTTGEWESLPDCLPRKCNDAILSDNIINPETLADKVFGQEVSFSCKDGFEISDNSAIQCSSNGEWNNLPSCMRIVCDNITLSNNLNIDNGLEIIRYGDEVVLSCNDGYVLSDNSSVKCNESGKWNEFPTCNPVECKMFTLPDNMTLNSAQDTETNEFSFNKTLNLSCDTGFKLIGNSEVKCLSNGSWTVLPSCNITSCGEFTETIGAGTVVNSTGSEFNDNVMIQCDSNSIKIIRCLANGTWERTPKCTNVSCENFEVQNGQMMMVNSTFPIGTSFEIDDKTILCDVGFEIVGNSSIVCQSNGNWSDFVECFPITCDPFETPANATSDANTSDDSKYEDKVNVTCNPGYTSEGDTVAVCNGSGMWINVIACDPITCKDINIARVAPLNETHRFGDLVNITCEDGYVTDNETTVSCSTTGEWESLPDCRPRKCDDVMLPDNIASPEPLADIVFGQEVSFSCDVGFEISDNSTIQCSADGVWKDLPTCNPVECKMFSLTDNMTFDSAQDTETNAFSFNKTLNVSCDTGFELIGNSEVTCLSNGSWTALPTCNINSCGEFTESIGAGTVVNSTGSEFNDNVMIKCDDNSIKIIRCLANGTWERTPKCTNVSCDNFKVQNGQMMMVNDLLPIGTSFEIDDKTILCDVGFEIVGNSSIVCQSNGNWSGFVECFPITCNPFETPANAISDGNTSDDSKYEDKVNVTCNPGYTSEGDTVAVCNGSGVWINVIACDPITCKEIDIAGVAPLNETHRFGDLVNITCEDGYVTDNETTVSCSTTGEWESLLDCRPRKCDDVMLPDNIISPETLADIVFGQGINFSCDVGFEISDNSTFQCSADGVWKDLPTCNPVECKMFSLTDNMTFDSAQDTETNALSFNTTLNVSCDTGFELIGNSEVTCLSNGSWTVLPSCNITSCGEFAETIDAGTVVNSTGSEFNDNVMIQCDSNSIKIIRCLANGTWERAPKCTNVSCDNFEVQNGQKIPMISMENDTFPVGSSVEIECDEGYEISENVSTTECLGNRTWSHDVTCTPVLCMTFVPPNDKTIKDVNNNETEFQYGSHLTIECGNGLTFYDGSLSTNLTCNATGMWSGEQNCGIIGEVNFETDHYSLNKGEDQTIVCNVTDYSDGQNLVIAKMNEPNDPIRLCVFSKSSGDIQSTPLTVDAFQFNYTVQGSGIVVEMKFLSVGNESCGDYTCALIVHDDDGLFVSKDSRTNVSVNDLGKPSMSIGDDEQLDAVNIQCTGYFDKNMTDDELYLETRHETNGSYDKITDSATSEYVVVDCQHTTTKSYVIPSEDIGEQLLVRCGIHSNGSFLNSEEVVINGTADEYATFENDSYVFAVGNIGVIVCDVNGENVSHVVVYNSSKTSLVNVTAADTEEETGIFTVNEKSFQETQTRVAVNVNLQDWCTDGGIIGSDTYTCEVTYKNGNKRSAETNVTVYKSASIQSFVKSIEIVEGKDSTLEKLFRCEAELGNPKGAMEIDIDRNDDRGFVTFLTLDEPDNNTTDGWIVNVTNTDSECGGEFQSVGFALRKVTKSLHLTSMRCTIRHPDDMYTQVVSKPSVLKVVEESYCNQSTAYELIPHPYYCHSAVACYADGTIQAVPPNCLSDDECFDTSTSRCDISCDAIGCKYEPIVCLTKTISSPEGADVDFICNTVDIGEPVIVVLVNDSDFNFETTDEQVISDNVNLTITDTRAIFSVVNVSCKNEEIYGLSFNKQWNTTLTLRVETDPDKPSIEVEPETPNANELMVIVCSGSVGRDKDNKPKGSVHLQVAKDGQYEEYVTEAISREVKRVDCAFIETVTYTITPGMDWNGTYVRCLTRDEAVDVATSTNYTVLLSVPDLYCNPVSTTTLIGDDVSFECKLQDIINVTSIELKVDSDGSTVTVVDETIPSLPWTSASNSAGIEVVIPDVNEFTYNVTNISCDQEGKYTVLINDKASAVMSIAIVSPPSKPTLYIESDTSENQLLEINCTAKLGRDNLGNAVSELKLEVKFDNETLFNTYTSGVNSTIISENCKHTGYVNLAFYPDGSWNNSVIRCVTRNGNNTYNESAEETVTLKPSSIYFDKKNGTGIVGENYTMTCIVDNMAGLHDIEITKDGINIMDDDGVFTLTRVINETSANLTIEKTIKCGDDGMYYCKPKGTSVEAQAETWISVIWNSEKPIVNLSPDIVEDSAPWSTFETLCTGEIGYNNASIYFQSNKNGKFENLTAIDSVKFPVIDYNPSECSNVKTIAFSHTYTADWNGTTFRCVVQDADRILMDTEIIYVVPESICHNKSIGETIPHPFDCRARFTCSESAKKLTPFSHCSEADTCFDQYLPCVACEKVDKCREDPSDIAPYMECTSTVATIGQLAYINCSLHHITIELPNATDVTLLKNETHIIQTDTPTVNDLDTATYVQQSGGTTLTVVVRSTTIDIVFDPVSCVHKGEYLLRYDNGTSTIEDTELLVVQRTASAAYLSKSTDAYYRGVETTLSCTGPIGQPEGSMELMYRRNSSEDFEPLSESTSAMSSTYDPDNCTYIGELHYTFVVRDALDGVEYRCKSVGHDNQEFYSHTEILNITAPAINFVDEQVTAEIDSTFEAKCMILKTDGASGANITLTSSNGTTYALCAVDDTFTNATVTSQPGYTAFILDESDHWLLVVSGTAACHHEGTLHCFSPTASEIKSSSELVITRPSSIPSITVQIAFDGRTLTADELSCTADVGYPPFGRVLKMLKKAASEGSFVVDVEVEESGGCEINTTTATPSSKSFELADNETEFKCVVYNTIEDTLVTESSTKILQVFPNECPTHEVFLPHPLECKMYLWCYNSGTLALQTCAGGACFNATSKACDDSLCTGCST